MHDLHDDEMVGAFARFRDDAMRDIRPAESGQIREVARRRRQIRVGVVAASAVLALVVPIAVWAGGRPSAFGPPVGTEPTAPVTPGPGDLRVQDLNGKPLELPAWPEFNGAELCPRTVTFADGRYSIGGVEVTIGAAAHADVDRDGRLELIAAVFCLGVEGEWFRDVGQVVAFAGTPAGQIRNLGQVITTSGKVGVAGGILSLVGHADGGVEVEVTDYGDNFMSLAQYQVRTYSYDGAAFVQTDGPTAFEPNPNDVDLAVTARPLVLGAPSGGIRRGTLTLEITSIGPAHPSRVRLGVTFPLLLSLPKTCQEMGGDSNASNTFFCDVGAGAPGETRTVTLEITAPATYRGGDSWPSVWVVPATSNDVLMPDLATYNDQAKVVITVA